MNKLVFISNIAAPIQVKFCQHLQKFYDAEFWFHERLNSQRPEWWKIDLYEKCKILNKIVLKKYGLYLSLDVTNKLSVLNPDIIILGGFKLLSNYMAYRWAKKNKKYVIVFSETFRKNGQLRKRNLLFKIIEFLYKDINALFSSSEEAAIQFREVFPKFESRIKTARYPSDIDNYFNHKIRIKKEGYKYLFANRLIDIYNPLLAIDIFNDIHQKYPKSTMLMNSEGELKEDCKKRINQYGLQDAISFLSEIKSWEDLPDIYKDCDILLFPAKFSNGNFSIIEAMASGMGVVISNNIIWNSSMIEENGGGFICTDKTDYLSAIDNYASKPELFKTHSEINREVVKPLTMSETAKLFHKLIEEI